jgi:hypothetical protein
MVCACVAPAISGLGGLSDGPGPGGQHLQTVRRDRAAKCLALSLLRNVTSGVGFASPFFRCSCACRSALDGGVAHSRPGIAAKLLSRTRVKPNAEPFASLWRWPPAAKWRPMIDKNGFAPAIFAMIIVVGALWVFTILPHP